jgi:AAA family ATP:ADP antiporter
VNLLLVSALILELAARASNALDAREPLLRAADEADDAVKPSAAGQAKAAADGSNADTVIGGGVMDGVKHVLKSPYLIGIAVLMLCFTIASTFLYFQQVDIVAQAFADDRDARTRTFGLIDLAVNILTLVTQLFLTGRVVKWFGVGVTLAFLPVVTLIGFAVLGVSPVLPVLIVFLVIRRAGNFAIQRPAREALYTVLPRSDKYKAKNFNDTFVYRLGDQMGAWSYTWMGVFGLGLSGLAFSMVPLSAVWLVLALWLGREYKAREGRV